MSVVGRIRSWRDWFPVTARGWRQQLCRWSLFEGNRLGIVGALLTIVFATLGGSFLLT
jgi:hypothetical protein